MCNLDGDDVTSASASCKPFDLELDRTFLLSRKFLGVWKCIFVVCKCSLELKNISTLAHAGCKWILQYALCIINEDVRRTLIKKRVMYYY